MSPTLIYVLGSGSSGSTILSMLLGSHSEMFSAGEIKLLDHSLEEGRKCSCGDEIQKCSFWSQIEELDTVETDPGIADWEVLFPGKTDAVKSALNSNYAEENTKLVKQISQKAETPYVVESSKSLSRLYLLKKADLDLNIVPVLIVRDSRAYIHSMKKKNLSGSTRAMTRWIRLNISPYIFLKQQSRGFESVLTVSYKELCLHTESTLERLQQTLSLPSQEVTRTYRNSIFHNISGSQNYRFDPKPIIYQNKWESELSPSDYMVYYCLGGPVWNRLFGVWEGPPEVLSDTRRTI